MCKRKLYRLLFSIFFLAAITVLPINAGEVTDGIGRPVSTEGDIDKVVSLAPNLTEMIYTLKAQKKLVGVTKFCDYPPEVKNKKSVGGLNPGVESIVSLKPDLILLSAQANIKSLGMRLIKLDYTVYVDDTQTLDDIPGTLSDLGKLLDREKESQKAIKEYEQKLKEYSTTAEIDSECSPKIIYLVWTRPIMAAGGDNFVNDLIQRAGCRNPASDLDERWPRLTIESLHSLKPDIIIHPQSPKWKKMKNKIMKSKRWQALKAIRNGDIYPVKEDIINRPTTRTIKALKRIREILKEWENAGKN